MMLFINEFLRVRCASHGILQGVSHTIVSHWPKLIRNGKLPNQRSAIAKSNNEARYCKLGYAIVDEIRACSDGMGGGNGG